MAVRTLLGELRLLKDRSGYDLRALASKTHSSRSSWGRWLSGETWIPREAVASMAELCAGDPDELNALWQRAEDERRARRFVMPSDIDPGAATVPGQHITDAGTAAESSAGVAAPTGTATTPHPMDTIDPATAGHPPGADGTPGTDGTPGAIVHERPASPGDRRAGRPRWGRIAVVTAVLGCTLAAAAAGFAAGLSVRKAPPRPSHPYTQWLSRQEILGRLQAWHPHTDRRIPYSQTGSCQGYRTDGSGYASMAIGLPTPGRISTELASSQYTRRISPAELLPGDLIINPTGDAGTRQVAVFHAWADATHTRYWVYQQRREYGTDHLVLSFPLGPRSPYHAYRPLNIHETTPPRPADATP